MSTQAARAPMTLPAKFFTDPEVFRAEMERFFFGKWVCAGRADQIPGAGDYFLREIAGESVIITRDTDGAVRAFFNVCRHRGTRMCTEPQGAFAGRIACPYHGWTYALDGALVGAPHMDQSPEKLARTTEPGAVPPPEDLPCIEGRAGPVRATFSRADYPLHRVHTGVWDGHIFLNFAERPQPLAAQLAALPEKFAAWRMQELRLARRVVYDVKANWKLIVLNYNECLHCPLVHPAINKLTSYLSAENEPPAPGYIGGAMTFRDGVETMSMDGVRRREYLPGLTDVQRKVVCYYTVYPNLLLSLHPDYMMTHTLWPKAVDRTEIVCEWHFHPDEMARPDFRADDAIEFWDLTNREDWNISELSQLGIQSRAYTPGPYSYREELLRAFDEIVR